MKALYLKTIHYLTTLGCEAATHHEEAKRIRLSNYIYLIYFCLLITYIPIFALMKAYLLSFIISCLCAGIGGAMVLNKFSCFLSSRSLFIMIISIPIYWFAGILGPASAVQIVIFVTMTISFVLFNEKQTLFKYFFIL